MNKRFLLLRILVSPIIFALILVGHNYSAVKRFYLFMRYGGEFISFENNERPTIEKIYQKLKEEATMAEDMEAFAEWMSLKEYSYHPKAKIWTYGMPNRKTTSQLREQWEQERRTK